MDDILSWILAVLVILAYTIPMVLGFLFTVGTIGSAIWAIVDMPVFMSFKGKIKRGFRVSSKSLTIEQMRFLKNLSGNIIEYKDNLIENGISAFIIKQDSEVLIHAKQWYGFRWRRSWPFVGYVNLSIPDPIVEFRSSLPFHLFLVCLAFSIILLPFIIGMWVFSFNMERQTIENFLQDKVKSTLSQKESKVS
jgi:hypothetical protein